MCLSSYIDFIPSVAFLSISIAWQFGISSIRANAVRPYKNWQTPRSIHAPQSSGRALIRSIRSQNPLAVHLS
jgi:hypothetical protein